MKKIRIIVSLLVILLIPFNGYASSDVNYSSASVTGPDNVKTGDTVNFDFNIRFSGLKKDTYDTKGLISILIKLNFDPNILFVTGLRTPNWDSEIKKINNEYYLFSVISDDDNSKCKDDFLHCGDYSGTLTAFIQNTNIENTYLEMGTGYFYLYEVNDDDEYEYSEDELIIKIQDLNKRHSFTVTNTGTKLDTPESIITETNEKPTESIKSTVSQTVSNNNQNTSQSKEEVNEVSDNKKSSNKYLKSLEVKNYKIDFTKEKKLYNIMIKGKTNSLKIDAIAEDDKATIEVIGADDLAKNDYEVTVKVTAEDGSKSNYVIIAKKDKKENKKAPFYKKYKKEIIIGGSILLSIVLIIVISNCVNNKRIDKSLEL